MTTMENVQPTEVSTELNLTRFEQMMTDVGIWQHSRCDTPDCRHGYSIDDQARALIVGVGYAKQGLGSAFWSRVSHACLAFLERAAIRSGPDRGRFHNFADDQGKWIDGVGSDDLFGRTLWALCIAEADAPEPEIRERARTLVDASLPLARGLRPLRSQAFVLLGLTHSRPAHPLIRTLADRLAAAYHAHARDTWHWFEDGMTYCNARLPQALFQAAEACGNAHFADIAGKALPFLLTVVSDRKGGYAPIGNNRLQNGWWFSRSDRRPPLFDQQPVDAGALTEACVAGFRATGEIAYRSAALTAYRWYFGQNIRDLSVYDPQTGAVADALTPAGLNRNCGAELLISIHLARLALMDL